MPDAYVLPIENDGAAASGLWHDGSWLEGERPVCLLPHLGRQDRHASGLPCHGVDRGSGEAGRSCGAAPSVHRPAPSFTGARPLRLRRRRGASLTATLPPRRHAGGSRVPTLSTTGHSVEPSSLSLALAACTRHNACDPSQYVLMSRAVCAVDGAGAQGEATSPVGPSASAPRYACHAYGCVHRLPTWWSETPRPEPCILPVVSAYTSY